MGLGCDGAVSCQLSLQDFLSAEWGYVFPVE